MVDINLSLYKVMDCPLLTWEEWKTTFEDCKRCLCARRDVYAAVKESLHSHTKPYIICDLGKGESTHFAV